ncbi:MAG: 30S ribosomal protein S4 [Parcubacteria group bacterium ADurb.Bin159]|jgi:small subunit ribosomal protein S4|nr:MAG: 30S ribosomal protein S4 [Parcubacteria group bacterium ADurb.Bin159]
MSRDLSPKCKLCRREGKKLFLKGERCYTPKCALNKRKYPPGVHGAKGRPRLSEYGLELRTKQQLKRSYRITETQLKNSFKKADRKQGDTSENLIRLLEKRLDNVIWRAGFAVSRDSSRQMINHGNVLVNNRRIDIPSYQVKIGDEIKIKPKMIPKIKEIIAHPWGETKQSSWFSIDKENLAVKILTEPKAEDLPKDIDLRLIVQFYSK